MSNDVNMHKLRGYVEMPTSGQTSERSRLYISLGLMTLLCFHRILCKSA